MFYVQKVNVNVILKNKAATRWQYDISHWLSPTGERVTPDISKTAGFRTEFRSMGTGRIQLEYICTWLNKVEYINPAVTSCCVISMLWRLTDIHSINLSLGWKCLVFFQSMVNFFIVRKRSSQTLKRSARRLRQRHAELQDLIRASLLSLSAFGSIHHMVTVCSCVCSTLHIHLKTVYFSRASMTYVVVFMHVCVCLQCWTWLL